LGSDIGWKRNPERIGRSKGKSKLREDEYSTFLRNVGETCVGLQAVTSQNIFPLRGYSSENLKYNKNYAVVMQKQ
jgi:hypothetical protein